MHREDFIKAYLLKTVDYFSLKVYTLSCKQCSRIAMKATAKDLRFQTNDLLNTVKRGEEVIISYHGKPCAKLTPLDDEDNNNQVNELFGIWEDNNQIDDVNEHIRNLRKGRAYVD